MKNTAIILIIYFIIMLEGGALGHLLEISSMGVQAAGYLTIALNLQMILVLYFMKLAGRRSAWAPVKYWMSSRLLWTMLCMLLMGEAVSYLFSPLNLDDGGTSGKFAEMVNDPICLAGLCVVAPLAEELIFRDGILRSLIRWRLPANLSVVVSALIFGLVHGNLQQGVTAVLMGIVLGLLFIRTGDLRLCLPAHIFNNVLAVMMIRDPELVSWSSGWSVPVQIGVGAVLLILGFCVLVFKILKK